MRRPLAALAVLMLAAGSLAQVRGPATNPTTIPATTPPPKPAASGNGTSVYFSPDGNCAAAVVYWIGRTTKTLDLAVYSVTHADIARAIVEAQRRGVKVRLVMDSAQAAGRYSSATFLANMGVPVRIDTAAGLMHNKYAICDGRTLLTGSFNWTTGGDETNRENLLVIEGNAPLVAGFQADYEGVYLKSKPYVRPE